MNRSIQVAWRGLATILILLVSWAPAQDARPLEERVQHRLGARWYGAYMLAQKVGWVETRGSIVEEDGDRLLLEEERFDMQIRVFGETSDMKVLTRTWYRLEGPGEILRVEEQLTEDGVITTKTLEKVEEAWRLTTRTQGRESTREVAAPKVNLVADAAISAWLRSSPQVGDRRTSWSLDLEKEDINSEESIRYRGAKKELVSGVPTMVYEVVIRSDGARMRARVINESVFLEMTIGGVLKAVAEDERTAKRRDLKPKDLTEGFSVLVKRDMGEEPGPIDALTAEVTGLGEFVVPETHRQRLEKREGQADLLHLKRDHRVEKAVPLSESDRTRYSRHEPGIESHHEVIQDLAKRLVGEEKDVAKRAQLIQAWIYRELDKSSSRNSNSALTILEQRAGDCTEHARLFVALARALGMPAREIGGLIYVNFDRPLFGWHAWAEVHDGHQWISVDPAWDQVFVDATHIRMSSGTEDMSWMNVMGTMKLKVVSFEK